MVVMFAGCDEYSDQPPPNIGEHADLPDTGDHGQPLTLGDDGELNAGAATVDPWIEISGPLGIAGCVAGAHAAVCSCRSFKKTYPNWNWEAICD